MKISLTRFKNSLRSPRTLNGINPDRDWRIMLFVFIAFNAFVMVLNINYYQEINLKEDFFQPENTTPVRTPLNVAALETMTASIQERTIRYSGLIRQPIVSVDPSY